MSCKACKSENVQNLNGELTASFTTLKALRASPLYVCQNILVCLNCGFTELVIPTSELESLKRAMATHAS
jgi:hypothetical protein